ncbi:MAG: hypothetical protein ABR507_06735 [Actinomycetota bacterium]|nr:hypothetical protein [Actinomycetota bacterium]
MPGALRSRIALFALMGAFLLPISVSGLRGLTHTLTCQDRVETPFTMVIHESGPPEVISSTRITRGQEEGLCGGLLLDLRAKGTRNNVKMKVLITNDTDSLWRGTVQLTLSGTASTAFPVRIGSIAPGKTASDTVNLKLPTGSTEMSGSLLLGP